MFQKNVNKCLYYFVVHRCAHKRLDQHTDHGKIPITEIQELIDEQKKPNLLPNASERTFKRPHEHPKHSTMSKRVVEERPPQAVRYNNTGHYPEVDGKQHGSRCKLEHCKLKSNVYCIKCGVHLCLKSGHNCFHHFHCENK